MPVKWILLILRSFERNLTGLKLVGDPRVALGPSVPGHQIKSWTWTSHKEYSTLNYPMQNWRATDIPISVYGASWSTRNSVFLITSKALNFSDKLAFIGGPTGSRNLNLWMRSWDQDLNLNFLNKMFYIELSQPNQKLYRLTTGPS